MLDVFVVPDHQQFTDLMLAYANRDNLKLIIGGFQTVPLQYNIYDCYEIYDCKEIRIKMWNVNGTITSPWFEEAFDQKYYQKDRSVHVALEFPENFVELIGDGSLLINLEVDIRQEEGWIEEVKYQIKENEYMEDSNLSWALAEAKCSLGGGRLSYGFICHYDPLKTDHSLSLSLTREELNFHFQVWYKYRTTTNQALLDNWTQKGMTGFRLSWRIENPVVASSSIAPQYSPDPSLLNAIHFAREMRINNFTDDDVHLTIKEKSQCEEWGHKSKVTGNIFETLFKNMSEDIMMGPIDHEKDILNGFKIYFTVLSCLPETSKTFLFFDQLISGESKRTLLQATVNTIQAVEATELNHSLLKKKEKVSMFYQALDKIFDLQFGKILLAVSTKEELQFMFDKGWAFFGNLTNELGHCLNGTRCTQIAEAIQNLGG